MDCSPLMCRLSAAFLVMIGLLSTPKTFAAPSQEIHPYEARLIDTLSHYHQGSFDTIFPALQQFIEEYPNSQLGHLLMGDLLASRTGIIQTIGDVNIAAKTDPREQLNGLKQELAIRWNQIKHGTPAERGLIPLSLLQASADQPYIIFVDTQGARLYVFENVNNTLHLLRHSYATIGEQGTRKQLEGDEKTPVGVYFVTRYIADEELPPLYGTGAFPINYPNVIDRRHDRTGYGIWLHGTRPESINRVPQASNGCVALNNDEFTALRPYVTLDSNTPVIIADEPRWVAPESQEILALRKDFEQALQQWRTDWQSLDVDRYLSHYSPTEFKTSDTSYANWAARKRAIISSKTHIEVELSDISFYNYPSEEDMIVTSFHQRYLADDKLVAAHKRQYWQKDDSGRWQILFEGNL